MQRPNKQNVIIKFRFGSKRLCQEFTVVALRPINKNVKCFLIKTTEWLWLHFFPAAAVDTAVDVVGGGGGVPDDTKLILLQR